MYCTKSAGSLLPVPVYQTFTPPSSSPIEHHGPRVRLPNLVLKKFGGDPTEWITFWDSFESAVHINSDLTDMDKFNYLHSLLDKMAIEAISGLKLKAAN